MPPDFGADWWPRAWSAIWRLVVPAFDVAGELASFQARAVPDEPPKTRWPRGLDAGGLLFADPQYARPMLRGGPAPARLVIVEGLTDYLAVASHGHATLGIASGSISALRLLRLPESCVVIVATDYDRTGQGVYAAQIAEALAPAPVRALPWRLAV